MSNAKLQDKDRRKSGIRQVLERIKARQRGAVKRGKSKQARPPR